MEFNPLGDRLGRIHMQKQDLGQLQTRKVKALRSSDKERDLKKQTKEE